MLSKLLYIRQPPGHRRRTGSSQIRITMVGQFKYLPVFHASGLPGKIDSTRDFSYDDALIYTHN